MRFELDRDHLVIKLKLHFVLDFYQINGDGEIWTHDYLVIKTLTLCQKTNSTQKLKLLGGVLRYDLYYSLTYFFKWKSFELETCTNSHYLLFDFYQINKNGKIRTRDHLVIKKLSQLNSLNF
jgi:ribosomal protein L10